MPRNANKRSVLLLYNSVGEDEYETLRTVDPASLGFIPEYHLSGISTVKEEYVSIAVGLERAGFRVSLYNARDNFFQLQSYLRRHRPDVIFNLIEHFHDSQFLESAVAGIYDLMNIPYTGAHPFSLALCLRKGYTKQILLANGVPTPKFRLLFAPKVPQNHGLSYPLIVKPAREDASSGVDRHSVVHHYTGLRRLVKKLFREFSPPLLVEEYVEGREFHASILGNGRPTVLPLLEYDFSELPKDHPNIITYNAKWNPLDESFHRIHAVCPARITARQRRSIERIALAAYDVVECRDYARIDLRLDRRGNVFVLEVNPNPDLTEGVSFMESAEKAGLSFSATLRRIVELALKRSA